MKFKISAYCQGKNKIKFIAYHDAKNGRFLVQELKLKRIKKTDTKRPFLIIDEIDAQDLMGELWDCGIRPPYFNY